VASERAFDGIHSASLLPFLFLLSLGLVGLFRICRTRYRLNGGVGAGFLQCPFMFSAPCPFLYRNPFLLRGLLHLRLLLCLFLAFTADAMAALQQPSDGMRLSSLLPLLCLLIVSLIGLFRLCRIRYRVNGVVGAFLQRCPFVFSASSPFLCIYLSHPALSRPTKSLSLPTERWRRSGPSTEYIQLLCSLSFSFSP